MKKKILLFISIGLILATAFILSYIILDEEKIYEDITYNEFISMYENDETFVLFVYQDGCSHCALVEPKLNKVIDKYKLDVYGINLANLSSEEYDVFLKKTFVTGTPSIIYYKQGALQANKLIGDKSEDQIETYFESIKIIE